MATLADSERQENISLQSSKDGILHRGGYVWKLAAYSISRLNCEQVMYREQCNVRYPEEGEFGGFLVSR